MPKKVQILSLDAILDLISDSEMMGDDMTVCTVSQDYVAHRLESMPDEGMDLVDLFSQAS